MSARAMRFAEFCAAIGFTPRPGQRVLTAVGFDGVQPGELTGEDRELASRFFGPLDRVETRHRAVVVWVCGGRGGKSQLAALRLLHLALTVDLSKLGVGEVADAPIIAPKLALARQTLAYVRGVIKAVPALAAMLVRDAADELHLKRASGHVVSLTCRAASAGGAAGRGRSLVGFVLDESAFFGDESAVVADAEIYRALAPRVIAGGQGLVVSTPWGETGLLHDAWKTNFAHPVWCLCAHAPTLALRDEEHVRAQVAAEFARDATNAAREFGAEFMSSDGRSFFSADSIRAAVALPEPPSHRDEQVAAGADFAFRSDHSALVVTVRRGRLFDVVAVEERSPRKGEPLSPRDLAADFASVAQGHGAEGITADGHSFTAMAEHLGDAGLWLGAAPAGQQGKVESYDRLRTLLREGRVRLPDHPRLLQQLREVRAVPTSGGGLSISSPRTAGGGHGDLVSALVLAVWAAGDGSMEEPDTRTRAQKERERIEAELAEPPTGGDPFASRLGRPPSLSRPRWL